MYKEYQGLHLPQIDKEILDFWRENDIFQKSIKERDSEDSFIFYEGPPSANGMPGIHHVMARTVKDLFCRFHTMLGKRVERKGGWDTHGLPVELQVEKELGITKDDIGKSISVEEYNKKCRETVMRYKDQWDDLTRKMGYWVDLEHPYMTFDNSYIESVWHLLKMIYNKGYLYKGYTVQPYSPAAGTGLSSHELNMPGTYKEVSDTTITAQFKIKRDEFSEFLYDTDQTEDIYFLAWTTTPWTLPSNTALSVGKKIKYVKIRTFNPYTHTPEQVILAKDLVGSYFKPEGAEASIDDYDGSQKILPYRVLDEFSGSELEGIHYEQLMPYAQPENGRAFVVVTGNHVTTEDGTGIVHTAPSFGGDDMMMAREHGLGSLTLVDKHGRFMDEVTDLAGRYIKDYRDEGESYRNPDVDIAIKLKEENKAFNVQKYAHNYPHCWRTDKPVLYYPLDSWFIKSTAKKEEMVALNKEINWKPEHTGTKRFGHWLENLQDWNLSRSRYWGTPLPIWRSADGESEICIGSVEELRLEIDKANEKLQLTQSVPTDLHRPYIDDVILVDDRGERMVRESDLIDVWFDSGAMPYAQWHYPFENEKKFEKKFPADFIAEGVDQTRGWFFTLHAIATLVYDQKAFKNVVSNGLVLDKNGQKMSKRLGNAVDPFDTIESHGADATRWYMISNAQPWDNLKFDMAGIEEVKRKFFGTLYNTYSFFALYANLDSFSYKEEDISLESRSELDRWILSKLHSLIADVHNDYADYEATNAARRIQDFVDQHLSNWYVRLSRRRFWKGDYTQDKISAYQTLYTCLVEIAKMMSPIAPFFSDWLYRNLNLVTNKEDKLSVHLSLFPDADQKIIDTGLEERMSYAQRVSSLVLSLRKGENIRVRQPLHKVIVVSLIPDFEEQIRLVTPLIKSEVNVKEIEVLDDSAGVIQKSIKPNFKTLGKRLGSDMKAAAQKISEMGPDQIAEIEQTGKYDLEIDGKTYELTEEDFVIQAQDIPGWLVATDGDLTVALDVTISPELEAEGTAKELINRIQNLRKDSGLEVTDRINVVISPDDKVSTAIEDYGQMIKNEVLADEITVGSNDGQTVPFLDGEDLQIEIEKV